MTREQALELLDQLIDVTARVREDRVRELITGKAYPCTGHEHNLVYFRARLRLEFEALFGESLERGTVYVPFNTYQLANTRWLFRQTWRLTAVPWHQWTAVELLGGPSAASCRFNSGDWFGEVPTLLVQAAQRGGAPFLGYRPNTTEGDGPSPWDTMPV